MGHILSKAVAMLLLASVFSGPSIANEQADRLESFQQAYANFNSCFNDSEFECASNEAKRALEIAKILPSITDEQVSILRSNYVNSLLLEKNFSAAKDELSDTLEDYSARYGINSSRLIPLHQQLGDVAIVKGDGKDMRRHYDHALEIAASSYGEESLEYARFAYSLGMHAKKKKQYVYSTGPFEISHNVFAGQLGIEDAEAGESAFQLATVCKLLCSEDAVTYYYSAIKAFGAESNVDKHLDKLVLSHLGLAGALIRMNSEDRAELHLDAARDLLPDDYSSEPVVLARYSPAYPIDALRAGKEAQVYVAYTVDAEGQVVDPVVIDTAAKRFAEDFNQAAVEAVARFRYMPGYRDGKPVGTKSVKSLITFRMHNSEIEYVFGDR